MVNKYYSPPHLGGVEIVVRTLSEGLVEHAGAQVRALVSNESRHARGGDIGGVGVVRLPRQLALSSAPVAPACAGLAGVWRAYGPGAPEPPQCSTCTRPTRGASSRSLLGSPDVPSVVLYHSDIVRQKRLLDCLSAVSGAISR